jgi:hypothetical protein
MSQSHLNGYNHSGSLWTYCICPICTKLIQIAPTIFPSIIFPCLRITGCFMPSFHLSCSLPNGSDQPAKECQIGESFLRVPNTEGLKFQMYPDVSCLNNCCGCGRIRNSMTCPRTQGSDSVGRPCMCPTYAPDRTYNLHEMHTWKLSIFTLPCPLRWSGRSLSTAAWILQSSAYSNALVALI